MAWPFFTRPKGIAWLCMVSGCTTGGYAFANVIRYGLAGRHGTITPLFGTVPMAFSTAALFVFEGISTFWVGWLIREQQLVRKSGVRFSTSQITQLILGIISSLTLIIVTLVGALTQRH